MSLSESSSESSEKDRKEDYTAKIVIEKEEAKKIERPFDEEKEVIDLNKHLKLRFDMGEKIEEKFRALYKQEIEPKLTELC